MSTVKNYMRGMRAGGVRSIKGYQEAQQALWDIMDMVNLKWEEVRQLIGTATTLPWDNDRVYVEASGVREELLKKLQQDDADLYRIANFISQVHNGGFMQWGDNRYASADISQLLKILPKYGPVSKQVAKIVAEFGTYIKRTETTSSAEGAGFYRNREPSFATTSGFDKRFGEIDKEFVVEVMDYYLGEDNY